MIGHTCELETKEREREGPRDTKVSDGLSARQTHTLSFDLPLPLLANRVKIIVFAQLETKERNRQREREREMLVKGGTNTKHGKLV